MSGADAAEHTVGEEGAAAALFPPVDDGALLEEMPGLAEACRRFPMPDGTQAERALRELSWGEHFVAGRMVPSKGGSDLYLYSLKSAAVFLLDRDQANIGKASDQIIKLIDVDAFIAWVRGTVGDEALADAPETLNSNPYGAWIIKVEGIGGTEELLDAAAYEAHCAEEG